MTWIDAFLDSLVNQEIAAIARAFMAAAEEDYQARERRRFALEQAVMLHSEGLHAITSVLETAQSFEHYLKTGEKLPPTKPDGSPYSHCLECKGRICPNFCDQPYDQQESRICVPCGEKHQPTCANDHCLICGSDT